MRAPVLLNLLKDLRKRNELQGLPQNIFIIVVYYKNFIVNHIIYISCCRSYFYFSVLFGYLLVDYSTH